MDNTIQVMKKYLRTIQLITIFIFVPFLYSVYWEMENKFEMVACIILMALFITEIILYLNNNMFKLYLKISDNGKEYSNSIINTLIFILFIGLAYFLFLLLIFIPYDFKSILIVYTTTRIFAPKFAGGMVISKNHIVSGYDIYFKQFLKSFAISEKNFIECAIADSENTSNISSDLKETDSKADTIKIRVNKQNIQDVYEVLTRRQIASDEQTPSIVLHFQKMFFLIFQIIFISLVFIPILIQSENWFNKNIPFVSDFLYIAIFVYVLLSSLIILSLEKKFFLASIPGEKSRPKKGSTGIFYWFVILASLGMLNLYFFILPHNEFYIHLSNLGLFTFLVKGFVAHRKIASSHKYSQEP